MSKPSQPIKSVYSGIRPHLSRGKLLDIAEDLFVKKGYEGTSINDILKKAKLSKGGFYHYFKSKDEIFSAVIDKHLLIIRQEMETVVADKNLTAPEKLEFYITRIITTDHFHNYLFSAALVTADITLCSRVYFDRARKLILPLLLKIVDQGMKDGSLKVNNPRESLELLLLMKQAAVKFLPDLFKDKKSFFRYAVAMNDITEKTLGLKPGFFNQLITKNIKNKSLLIKG